MILTVILLIVSMLSLMICRKEIVNLFQKIKSFSFKKAKYSKHWALMILLFLAIGLVVMLGTVTNRDDAVVETVLTTLMTDTMNVYHPFTREPLKIGIILSRKLITLPFWYSLLSIWTGLGAIDTVWTLGTLIIALGSLLAFAELGGLLFFRDFKKTWLLVVLMELLYLSGDYYVKAAGYRQLFYGYSGEVIVATLVLPCVLSILYRFFGPYLRADFPLEQERISLWGLITELALCMGCCFFLVPMVWGIYLVLIAAILFMLSFIGVRLTKKKGGK